MKTEIRFNNEECTEMTIYLPNENRTYFLSVNRYDEILRRIKFPRIDELENEIVLFLERQT